MIKSKVYSLEAPERLSLVERELDDGALPAEHVFAKTIWSVISPGTELAAWEGLPPLRPSKVYPRLMGYCNVAEVVSVGKDVGAIQPGDKILTHQSHCSHFICDQSEILYQMGSEVSESSAKALACTYLYHLGYAAIRAGNFFPGDVVGIVGVGTLGVSTALLLKNFGCEPYLFTNQQPLKQKLSAMGLERFHLKQNLNLDADIVINTSNRWEDHQLCMHLARLGGTIVNLGFPGRGESAPKENPLDSRYFYDKQLKIVHCGYVTEKELPAIENNFTLKRNINYLADLIKRGVLKPQELFFQEFSSEDLGDVYRRMSKRQIEGFSCYLNWTNK